MSGVAAHQAIEPGAGASVTLKPARVAAGPQSFASPQLFGGLPDAKPITGDTFALVGAQPWSGRNGGCWVALPAVFSYTFHAAKESHCPYHSFHGSVPSWCS